MRERERMEGWMRLFSQVEATFSYEVERIKEAEGKGGEDVE